MRFRPVVIGALAVFLLVAGLVVANRHVTAADTAPMAPGPANGYTLHIDADQHFGDAHPSEIAHHWCKPINANLSECQLYDSDGPGAKLVGVETIVPTAVWKTFSPAEQKLWHYHRVEISKVHATLPDTPKDQQQKVIASLLETYGKVWILWDPASSDNPTVQPSITILH